MTIEKIEEMISDHYQDLDRSSDLKDTFKQVLVKFLQFHHVEDTEFDSLFCTIHNNFKVGHNCVACNLHESNRRIQAFLLGYKHFTDTYTVLTSFILLLYLQVENIDVYFKIMQLSDDQRKHDFQPLITIKRWANFLKHPKTFLLVHHPNWKVETDQPFDATASGKIIDTIFVNKYYAGRDHNVELYNELLKERDITVLFPDPVNIIEQFCKAQKKFVDLIEQNQKYRDLLDNQATIHDFYIHLDEDECKTE